jgi:hypothetical protein
MKKKNIFMAGILALALVFAFVLTGCPEEDPEAVSEAKSSGGASGNVSLPGIDNPVVTVRVLSSGVRLSWYSVMEADSYQIWRKFGNQNIRIYTKSVDNNLDSYTYTDNSTIPNTTYTYTVLAMPSTPVRDHGRWSSTVTTYPPLFGDDGVLTVNPFTINGNAIPNDGTTVTGFYASLQLSQIKATPGVLYSVERATLDAKGNPGSWSTPTLSLYNTSDTPLPKQEMDIFGNLSSSLSAVFDRSLPPNEATYVYRLKGVRTSDNLTEYLPGSQTVEIDFKPYLTSRISLNIGGKGGEASAVYTITPGLSNGTRKNILKEGDKVVLYWIVGKSDCYLTGPYNKTNIVVFGKSDIESALETPTTKPLDVPLKGGNNEVLYVQAWLERVNGDKLPLKEGSNWTGAGLQGLLIRNNEQWHQKLNY